MEQFDVREAHNMPGMSCWPIKEAIDRQACGVDSECRNQLRALRRIDSWIRSQVSQATVSWTKTRFISY